MSEHDLSKLPRLKINRSVFQRPVFDEQVRTQGLVPENPFQPHSGQDYNTMMYEITRLLPQSQAHPIYFGTPASKNNEGALITINYDTDGAIVVSEVPNGDTQSTSILRRQAENALREIKNGWTPESEPPTRPNRRTILSYSEYDAIGRTPENPIVIHSGDIVTNVIHKVISRLKNMSYKGIEEPAVYYGYEPGPLDDMGNTIIFRLTSDGEIVLEAGTGDSQALLKEAQLALERIKKGQD